jgi:hypothetical protein
MKYILIAILATLMGCATVSKETYNELLASHNALQATNNVMLTECTKLRQELEEWKPTEYEIQEKAIAVAKLEETLKDFTVQFANFMSATIGKEVEVKADEMTFLDDYGFAAVRIWLRFPDALGKYYMIFARDANGGWNYAGYYQVGIIPSTGVK